jgi:hypothetical protein
VVVGGGILVGVCRNAWIRVLSDPLAYMTHSLIKYVTATPVAEIKSLKP